MPSPAIEINVSRSNSIVAGSELNLTCTVQELFSGLTHSPMAIWTAASIPGTIANTSSADMAVAVLNINPLRASHPISYTCQGSLFTPAGNRIIMIQETIMIRPQSKLLFLCS